MPIIKSAGVLHFGSELRAQTAPSELAPELRPEGLDLRWSDIHPENFAPAVSVDAHRYDHRSETMRQLSRTFT